MVKNLSSFWPLPLAYMFINTSKIKWCEVPSFSVSLFKTEALLIPPPNTINLLNNFFKICVILWLINYKPEVIGQYAMQDIRRC